MREAAFAVAEIPSPIGALKAVATEKGLAYLGTRGERPERFSAWAERRLAGAVQVESMPALDDARAALSRFFVGDRAPFEGTLDVVGTPFQERVWAALREIPFGQTRTYAQIAAALGSPGAERAVGSANGANLIAILVPCHRVVGSDGALTGYAGGVRAKAKLLSLERAFCGQQRLFV